MTNSISNFMGI